MAKEIERKFLVREEILISLLQGKYEESRISQFYLVATPDVAVRLRKYDDEFVMLTVKHGGNMISTNEHEFPVPAKYYDLRLDERVGIEIVKTRLEIWHGGRKWEVDVFEGELAGLIVAELECEDAADVTDLPDWVGEEVTFDKRYKNAVLALEGKPVTAEELAAEMAAARRLADLLRRNGENVVSYLNAVSSHAERQVELDREFAAASRALLQKNLEKFMAGSHDGDVDLFLQAADEEDEKLRDQLRATAKLRTGSTASSELVDDDATPEAQEDAALVRFVEALRSDKTNKLGVLVMIEVFIRGLEKHFLEKSGKDA